MTNHKKYSEQSSALHETEEGRIAEVLNVQTRFGALPAEDVLGYLVITARRLPEDEWKAANGNVEMLVMIGGDIQTKLHMANVLAEQLQASLETHMQHFGDE